MAPQLSYVVFTDFDGTITRNDIGDIMFKTFGEQDESARAVHETGGRTFEAQENWRRSCETVSALSPEMFRSFLDRQEIDERFHRFEQFCSEKLIPIHILSDGFDLYIEHILRREKLGHLPFYSNRLSIGSDGMITPVFPHTDAECFLCANCKRNHLLTKSSDENVIVYVGNGHSDHCPARYADVVFAKGTLLKFCERENVTYHRYETFDDVLEKFRSLCEEGRPRKRRTAELARKDMFMRE
jgi:2,3-diketo-5-methylthio-1-phosphopentane phosphatase